MPNPALPATPVFTAGTPVFAPVLRASVADCVALITRKPLFAGQNNTGNSISNAANTILGWNGELADTWNGHQAGTTSINQTYYCQFPGWYLARVAVPYAYAGAAAAFACGFNPTTAGVTTGPFWGPIQFTGSTHDPLPWSVDLIEQTVTGNIGAGGDNIQAYTLQGSGAAVNLANGAGNLPYISLRWVAYTSGTTGLAVPANPAWPVPPAPVASAFGNTNITQAIEFLVYPPVCKAIYTPGAATLASTVFPAASVIDLTTVTVDNYGGFTTGASAGYTAPVAGNYLVAGQYNLASQAATTSYCAGLRVNSGTVQWGDTNYVVTPNSVAGAGVCKRLRLNSGDFVQLMGCQGSGAAVGYSAVAGNQTRMIAVWEGS
jgi:hypothetical protein